MICNDKCNRRNVQIGCKPLYDACNIAVRRLGYLVEWVSTGFFSREFNETNCEIETLIWHISWIRFIIKYVNSAFTSAGLDWKRKMFGFHSHSLHLERVFDVIFFQIVLRHEVIVWFCFFRKSLPSSCGFLLGRVCHLLRSLSLEV